jgi:hypothetical protein
MNAVYSNEEKMKLFSSRVRLWLLSLAVIFMVSSCFYGSISDFSEADIKGKENELYNPDFEEGEYSAETIPEGWVALDAKPNDIIWDNQFAKDDGKSLRIDTDKKVVLVSEAFSLKPNNVYYSRVFARTKDEFTQNVSISVVTFNKNGKKLDKYSVTHQVADKWKPVNITTGFFKGSAVFGRVIITVNTSKGHPVWLDQAGSYLVYEIK